MVTLSLCMIVRDEDEYISQCLGSIKSIVDEIIIIDTGSIDNTIEIAKKFGAKVISHKWKDDFSEARNISLKNATKEWILVLDGDEEISKEHIGAIKEAIIGGDCDAVRMIQHNYVNDVNHGGFLPLENWDKCYGSYVGWFPTPIIRLFRNSKEIFYEGKVHELVDKPLERMNGRVISKDIHILHYGFVRSEERKFKKIKHYSDIARKGNDEGYRSLYIKGVACLKNNQIKDAISCLEKAFTLMPTNIQLGYVLGGAYLQLEDIDSAITTLEKARKVDKDVAETFGNRDCYVDLYTNLGIAYFKKGLLDKALYLLREGLKYGKNPKIYNNLTAVCMSLNKPKKALAYICSALKIAPDDKELLSNFASILVQIGRHDHAKEVFKRLIELDKGNKEIWKEKLNALM